MKDAFDLQHPLFKPLWRRIAITALCFAWAGFEIWNDAPGWAAIFAASGAWCFYQFFVVWDPPDDGSAR